MRTSCPLAAMALTIFLFSCGGVDDPGVTIDPNILTLESGDFTVPTGESFYCFFTDTITDEELSVVSATAEQALGGHHMTLYYVDNKRPVGLQPCSGTSEMVDWHFVVGGGGEGNSTDSIIDLADGLGIKVPAGKQLMIQMHYINTTGKEQVVNDKMNVQLIDPAKVKAYVGDFVVLDDTFDIPANGTLESTSICEIPQDVNLSMLLGHMHDQGVHYKLETVDAQGNLLETLYEQDWQPDYASHPPLNKYTMEQPLVLKAGTRLRQTCNWNNSTPNQLLFPTEMCIAFGYYFPGEERVQCKRIDVPAAP